MLSRIFQAAAGRQRMSGSFLLERIVVVDQTYEGVIWSYLQESLIRRAAAFCARCSFSRIYFGEP